MKIYVSAKTYRSGDGSKEAPFKRINDAAAIARPGDEVIVAPGVYREAVDPRNGGTAAQPIVYRSEEKLAAVITGAEELKNWESCGEGVWKVSVPNDLFGAYNPYLVPVRGDWYFSPTVRHTGEIYLNDRSMYECDTLEDVRRAEPDAQTWKPEFSVYKWCTMQDNGRTVIYANFHEYDPNAENVEFNVRRNCFFPSKTGVNYITLSGFTVCKAATTWAPPTAFQDGMIGPNWSKGWVIEDCDISNSKCSGISLGKYLQPENENKWTYKRVKNGTQTERDAICQAQREGWTKENIGSHTVRRCHIHHCEQTGIVGHLGGVFSLIEDNHIHHINNKQQLAGAEIGGIKMHAAIDVVYRRNHIHHCTRGLWLDWQAQGTRVTQNLFHDNFPPKSVQPTSVLGVGEDIFVEVSHGPTLIDNNIFLSPLCGRLSTQGVAFVHNLICGAFTYVGSGTDIDSGDVSQPRYTPYHVPHRTEIAGFMSFLHGDDRFYNNIFVQKEDVSELLDKVDWGPWGRPIDGVGTYPFDEYPTAEEYFAQFGGDDIFGMAVPSALYYAKLPVYTGGNIFFNGAKPCKKEQSYAERSEPVYVRLKETDGKLYLETNLYEQMGGHKPDMVSTQTLGMAFEPEQLYENADGTPIVFNVDYFDAHRGTEILAGPFADSEELRQPLM